MSDTATARLAVRKTYKLYIGGAFPRSESGRSYVVTDHKGGFLANAAMASRKDARDAVVAARKAFAGWSAATAYNRGQVLYRVAELLEGRRAQFAAEVRSAEGLGARQAEAVVDAAIDRWVWYAGWADKIAQVRGAANPVAGPYFNFSAARADRRGRGDRARGLEPARLRLGRRARDRDRQHGGGPGQRALPAARGVPDRGAGHLGRARRRDQRADRPHGRGRALARLAHGRQRHRPDRRARPSWPTTWPSPPPRTSSASSAPAPTTGPSPPASTRMLAYLETKTVWHPVGI